LNKLKALAGQTAIYGLSSIIGRFLNYLLVPLYTYNLPADQYGIVTELYTYVGFLIILLTYGMETGFFRFANQEKDYREVYTTSLLSLLGTSSLFILIIVLFNSNIAELIGYGNTPQYILWFGIIIGADALTTIPFAKLRHENKAGRFAVIKLLNILINVGFNLFFIVYCPYLKQHSPNAWLITQFHLGDISVKYIFISNLIASLATLILLIPDIFTLKLKFNPVIWRKIIIYSLPLLLAGLAGMVNEMLDRILLKIYLPDGVNVMREIGIYGANYKIAILMTLFIQMFRYAADPFFFSQSKEKDAKKTYADVMKYFIIFGLLIFLGVMLYLDIIKYFIGADYREGLRIVPIILLANLFLGIIYNLSIWYKLTNRTRFGAMIAVFGAVITIVLNIILIPKIGYMGSAWATFFCYFSMMLLSLYLGSRYYKINYPYRSVLLYFALALSLYFASTKISISTTWIHLSVNTVLIGIFIIFVLLKEHIIFNPKKHLSS
jgi:O-antigen/teichoic acid export membrane protein